MRHRRLIAVFSSPASCWSRLGVLVVALCFVSCAQANEVSAAQAEANAAQSEAALSPGQLQALVKAQGSLASSAFPKCVASASSAPTKFTVIVELGASGEVKNSWALSDAKNQAFAQCFREAMRKGFQYTPPKVPFFTSFEYSGTK